MFCWRGNVVWKIATESSLKDLSHVDSDEFILAIPDFTKEPIESDDYTDHENSFASSRVLSRDVSRNAVFRKVIMKLSGGVRWIAGLVLERQCHSICPNCESQRKCRKFDFIPHYDVHLKKPECCQNANGGVSPLYTNSNRSHTIVIKDSGVISCTDPYPSSVPVIHHRKMDTIASTSARGLLPTSLLGGIYSPELCLFPSGKVPYFRR